MDKFDLKKYLAEGKLLSEENKATVFDDESMDALFDIILKYVEDPSDAEKELERFEAGGYDAFTPEVMANLDRDPEFGAWYNKLHSIKEEETSTRDAKDALEGQPNLDIYLDSLKNDIRLNGSEGYIEFGDDDWVEDYEEYMADRARA